MNVTSHFIILSKGTNILTHSVKVFFSVLLSRFFNLKNVVVKPNSKTNGFYKLTEKVIPGDFKIQFVFDMAILQHTFSNSLYLNTQCIGYKPFRKFLS